MKYFFYCKDGSFYTAKSESRNEPLNDLFLFITDKQCRWIKETEDESDSRKVIIWSERTFKEDLDTRNFSTDEELAKYEEQYQTYSRKRWKEMPCVRIFKDNLEFLEQQWQEVCKRKPKYLIFRDHENGFVDIIEKDELSLEDQKMMEREHKIYLNHLKRWNEYINKHPEKRYPVWRSPADDEYESDFALYDPADELGVDD